MKIDELAIYENGQDGPEPEESEPEEIDDSINYEMVGL